MFSKWTLLVAATALAPVAAVAAPMTASTYVMKAGAGDQYEIQSSKLELASTHDAKLRDFAQKMVTDHTQSTADVKMAAHEAGLHPAPPMPDAMGRANLAKLRAVYGAARDRLYVSQQKMSHQKALALHQAYAQDGGAAPLKAAAAKIVPVVQSHIDMLNGMS